MTAPSAKQHSERMQALALGVIEILGTKRTIMARDARVSARFVNELVEGTASPRAATLNTFIEWLRTTKVPTEIIDELHELCSNAQAVRMETTRVKLREKAKEVKGRRRYMRNVKVPAQSKEEVAELNAKYKLLANLMSQRP